MQKVTYLLGAGASAQCMPVVNKMAQDILMTNSLFYGKFQRRPLFVTKDENYLSSIEEHNKNVLRICDDLEWLGKICVNHYSVDTYAKKLRLKGDEKEYSKLKNVLSVYFTIKQKLYPPDKRYDNFWASILDVKDKLPKNMRIISWNYDSQLELSYRNFVSSLISLEEAYRRINMSSFHDEKLIDYNDFGIFKLNGSIRKIEKIHYSNYLVDNFNLDENEGFFEKLFQSYMSLHLDPMKKKEESVFNELSFAWEHEYTLPYYENLKVSVIDTKVLVVIGYSFPFFNRKLDKLIINEFMPVLDKVYFQAPDPGNLKERFLAITDRIPDHKIFLKGDENQFTFPNELDI